MNLKDFEIPEETHLNAIDLEAFQMYIENHYDIDQNLLEYIFDYIVKWGERARKKERAKWLGRVMRAKI